MLWWISLIGTSILIPIINYLFTILDIHRPINWIILTAPILLLNCILWWIFQTPKGYAITWFSSLGITTITAILISIFLTNTNVNDYKLIFGICFIILGVVLLNWR